MSNQFIAVFTTLNDRIATMCIQNTSENVFTQDNAMKILMEQSIVPIKTIHFILEVEKLVHIHAPADELIGMEPQGHG